MTTEKGGRQKGFKLSEEVKRKISLGRIKYWKESTLSEETRKKISLAKRKNLASDTFRNFRILFKDGIKIKKKNYNYFGLDKRTRRIIQRSIYKKSNKHRLEYRIKNNARLKAYRKFRVLPICQICKEKLAIQRHHNDYLKPLEVIFVCRECHKLQHKPVEGYKPLQFAEV